MGKSNKIFIIFIGTILTVAQLLSCRKDVLPDRPVTFIKTMDSLGIQSAGNYVEQMGDGGLLLLCSDRNRGPLIIRTNKWGEITWKKKANDFSAFYINGWFLIPHFIKTGIPGRYIGQISGHMFTFDTLGNIYNSYGHYNQNIHESDTFYSEVLQNGSEFVVGACNGLNSGINATSNSVQVYDQNLKLIQKKTFLLV